MRNQSLNECDTVLLPTPDGPRNSKTNVCSRNEESMLDYEGNMVKKKDRSRVLISIVEDNSVIEVSAVFSEAKVSLVNKLFYGNHNE